MKTVRSASKTILFTAEFIKWSLATTGSGIFVPLTVETVLNLLYLKGIRISKATFERICIRLDMRGQGKGQPRKWSLGDVDAIAAHLMGKGKVKVGEDAPRWMTAQAQQRWLMGVDASAWLQAHLKYLKTFTEPISITGEDGQPVTIWSPGDKEWYDIPRSATALFQYRDCAGNHEDVVFIPEHYAADSLKNLYCNPPRPSPRGNFRG